MERNAHSCPHAVEKKRKRLWFYHIWHSCITIEGMGFFGRNVFYYFHLLPITESKKKHMQETVEHERLNTKALTITKQNNGGAGDALVVFLSQFFGIKQWITFNKRSTYKFCSFAKAFQAAVCRQTSMRSWKHVWMKTCCVAFLGKICSLRIFFDVEKFLFMLRNRANDKSNVVAHTTNG